jgi:hypothetical protein
MTFMNFYCRQKREEKLPINFIIAFAAVFTFWRAHDENWQWQKTRKNLNARLGEKTGFIAFVFCYSSAIHSSSRQKMLRNLAIFYVILELVKLLNNIYHMRKWLSRIRHGGGG